MDKLSEELMRWAAYGAKAEGHHIIYIGQVIVDAGQFILMATEAVKLEARIEELEQLEKSWLALLREIAKLDEETDWDGADDDIFLEEFDPWHVLRHCPTSREDE